MRIGFYGGTFDPPHNAHLAVARAAADAFALDRVLFAPTGIQPLKPDRPHASFDDRLEMVRLLCQGDPRFEPSRLDRPHPDGKPNYTVDALTRLRMRRRPDDQLFTVVGADALESLPLWHNFPLLLLLTEWIVVSRPGLDTAAIMERVFPAEQRAHSHILDNVNIPVSSTALRSELASGLRPGTLMSPPVLEYVLAHHLYAT
jgi:nicotinate-nucleotide adenylyltransferase